LQSREHGDDGDDDDVGTGASKSDLPVMMNFYTVLVLVLHVLNIVRLGAGFSVLSYRWGLIRAAADFECRFRKLVRRVQ
jgi:hypothetical protein